MLVIRNAQLAALASAGFEAWLLDHLRRFFPEICDRLGDADAPRWVKAMADRARLHGLRNASDICSYLDLACTFGQDFDSQLPWAAAILAAANGRASTITMDRLHEAAIDALAADAAQPATDDADVGAAENGALHPTADAVAAKRANA